MYIFIFLLVTVFFIVAYLLWRKMHIVSWWAFKKAWFTKHRE